MTSLAFILGVMPLVLASGAGAVARQTIGYTVLGGMVAATSLAIFIVPVLFVLIAKVAYSNKELAHLKAHHAELEELERISLQRNIDPALELELRIKKEEDQEDSEEEKSPHGEL
jgi:HAE1 family hydrophobic/amphiphilic exporter-1